MNGIRKGAARFLCVLAVLALLSADCPPRAAAATEPGQIGIMTENLLRAPSVGGTKRSHAAYIARSMLESGFEPAFVAGLIANFTQEGSFGVFENLNYSSATTLGYVRHMHGWDYDDGHWDTYEKYSFYTCTLYGNDKYGVPVSLSEVSALVDTLIGEGYTTAIFGMGCMQWTYYSRLAGLFRTYRQFASGDHITEDECIRAELSFMQSELSGGYSYIYRNWKVACGDEPNSSATAYDAGYRVCYYYEIPSGSRRETVSEARGIIAEQIYREMTAGTVYSEEEEIPDEENPLVSMQIIETGDAGCVIEYSMTDNAFLSQIGFSLIDRETLSSVSLTLPCDAPAAEGTVWLAFPKGMGASRALYGYAQDTAFNITDEMIEWDGETGPESVSRCSLLRLPENTRTVEGEAFAGCAAEAVLIPAGCESVASGAFAGSPALRWLICSPDTAVSAGAAEEDVLILPLR